MFNPASVTSKLQNAMHAMASWLKSLSHEPTSTQMGLLSSSYIAYDNWPDSARHHMR